MRRRGRRRWRRREDEDEDERSRHIVTVNVIMTERSPKSRVLGERRHGGELNASRHPRISLVFTDDPEVYQLRARFHLHASSTRYR